MNSRAEENYLKALLLLSQKNAEISTNDVSKSLHIKMPTVTGMMKKFAQKDWVEYQSYKPIKLTELGRKEAALVVRKHRLTEMFLVQIMGFSWDEVHEIAEQVEHIKSRAFFDKMDEMLRFPKVDPHGAPIPDSLGIFPNFNYLKLTNCVVGDKVIIKSVQDSSGEFLQFLTSKGLALNSKIKVQEIHSFDKSLVIKFKKNKLNISHSAAEMIFVEKA